MSVRWRGRRAKQACTYFEGAHLGASFGNVLEERLGHSV